MKNKKGLIVGLTILAIISILGIYFVTKQDKETSFTIFEKQWLDKNKSKVIDISILKDIPVINYNGSGILFDFLSDFESVTGLDFNPIAYQNSEDIKTDYSFQVVSQKQDNDILVYSDSYALLTHDNVKYNKLSEIKDMTIGVLESDYEILSNIMENNNVVIKSYSSVSDMLNDMNSEDGENNINSIVLPRISNFSLIISNERLNISYNLNEIKQDYVIRLGNDDKLNEIIRKYFRKWKELKYSDSFDKAFSSNYFAFSNIEDKGKALFKSKKYVYGFVDNKPYDTYIDDELYGINKSFIKSFSDVADIDIVYKNYTDVNSLINDFNNGKVDLFFNNLSVDNINESSVDLISNYDEQIAVLTLPTNKVTVSSVKALIGYDVASISNSKISKYLENRGVSVKTYDSVDSLLDKIDSDTIVVLDNEVYNYYSSDKLVKYKSIYTFDMDDQYSFKVLDNDENKIFINYFNFYLSFVSNQELSNIGFSELTSIGNGYGYVWIIIVSVLLVLLISILIYQKLKNSRKRIIVPKDNKLRYIDMLTSLKNRNFLNDNIDSWDESMVYPQGIIIVDLNNIAYINDNYGHSEGDNVIKEAANILIKSQIANTEIIRTNGNEFLIYMVGYDEKQVVSYIRKLMKEFKNLSHGFGAAMGYSIITDEIKTVDDAINEATLDMRNVKEENR